MTFRTWIKKLFGLSSQFPVRRVRQGLHQHQRSFAPLLEPLEDRLAPANLVVINNSDAGAGSLRGQIAAANPGDTISFAASLDDQTITLTATNGPLAIAKNLTILGLGADQLTISGGNATGVFSITAGVVTISGLKITGGSALFGGGIAVTGGTANLTDLDIESNTTSGFGGGVRVDHAALNVTSSTVANNNAANYGAGIEADDSQVTITNSTIANNTTGNAGQSQGAAGIAIFGDMTAVHPPPGEQHAKRQRHRLHQRSQPGRRHFRAKQRRLHPDDHAAQHDLGRRRRPPHRHLQRLDFFPRRHHHVAGAQH